MEGEWAKCIAYSSPLNENENNLLKKESKNVFVIIKVVYR